MAQNPAAVRGALQEYVENVLASTLMDAGRRPVPSESAARILAPVVLGLLADPLVTRAALIEETDQAVGVGAPRLAVRGERAAAVASVRHSTELEGGRSTEAARALQDQWVDGEFGVDELGRRTRALYEPPPNQAARQDREGRDDELEVLELVERVLPDALIDSAAATLTPNSSTADKRITDDHASS